MGLNRLIINHTGHQYARFVSYSFSLFFPTLSTGPLSSFAAQGLLVSWTPQFVFSPRAEVSGNQPKHLLFLSENTYSHRTQHTAHTACASTLLVAVVVVAAVDLYI